MKSKLHQVDALIIPGNNADIAPLFYGEAPHPATKFSDDDPRETGYEIALVKYAVDVLGMPVLGICGGLHVINIAFGGKLIQHIENHNAYGEGNEYLKEKIALAKHQASTLSKLFHHLHNISRDLEFEENDETLSFYANCSHHQGIDENHFPSCLMISGRNSKDNQVELIESRFLNTLYGVQFHPEYVAYQYLEGSGATLTGPIHLRLIQAFIEASHAYSARKNSIAKIQLLRKPRH